MLFQPEVRVSGCRKSRRRLPVIDIWKIQFAFSFVRYWFGFWLLAFSRWRTRVPPSVNSQFVIELFSRAHYRALTSTFVFPPFASVTSTGVLVFQEPEVKSGMSTLFERFATETS